MASNRRWRCQFRCRGSRRESAVAQLFSLGHFRVFDFDRVGLAGDDWKQKHFDEQAADDLVGFSSRWFRAASKCGAIYSAV
jgi:hypothetical protein